MHFPYRGRSHTKKYCNLKPRLSLEERKKREQQKALLKLFPDFMSRIHQHYLRATVEFAGNQNHFINENEAGGEATQI